MPKFVFGRIFGRIMHYSVIFVFDEYCPPVAEYRTEYYPAVTRCPACCPVSFTHSHDRRGTATRAPPPQATLSTPCSVCPARTPGLLHTTRRYLLPAPSPPSIVLHTQPYGRDTLAQRCRLLHCIAISPPIHRPVCYVTLIRIIRVSVNCDLHCMGPNRRGNRR